MNIVTFDDSNSPRIWELKLSKFGQSSDCQIDNRAIRFAFDSLLEENIYSGDIGLN